MRKLFRPTLTRRVLLALLSAFCATWVVLIAFQYVEVRIQEDSSPGLRQAGSQLADMLSTINDPAEVRIVVAAIDRSIRNARQRVHVPGTVVLQVWDRSDSHTVFSSSPETRVSLPTILGRQIREVDHGQIYEVIRFDTARWSVLVAQSRLASDWVLKSLSSDLTKYMLVAFPFMLLPMWLAIRQGLRPLRELSERIASRGSEDLTPVGVDPKYAELAPLVTALDGLLVQMLRKVRGEQNFVANAAHELRTPLAVISAQAHVLVKGQTEYERLEAQRPLSAAIARASHLVHQLLVLARLEMAHSAPLTTTIDVVQWVREEIASLAPAAMARNMEISLEAPECLSASLDLHALQSVLQNLVDNAVRYGYENGRIVVELASFRLGRDVIVLAVADDGPGILECDRSRVFDRFYRGRHDDARGAGLGLTIVKQAAARMGGVVQVTSGLDGRGSRFEVHIPANSAIRQARIVESH
jgi:two-component system, OmpR family, sensor histidine kinase QseC